MAYGIRLETTLTFMRIVYISAVNMSIKNLPGLSGKCLVAEMLRSRLGGVSL